jgi:hypothetical protein
MYESKHRALAKRTVFYKRIARNLVYALALLTFSLLIGVIGYHYFCDLSWIDSLLNASMILTGMGPVNSMITNTAKIFASFYALFSGVAFLSTVGLLLVPVIHRMMHRFHLDDQE